MQGAPEIGPIMKYLIIFGHCLKYGVFYRKKKSIGSLIVGTFFNFSLGCTAFDLMFRNHFSYLIKPLINEKSYEVQKYISGVI